MLKRLNIRREADTEFALTDQQAGFREQNVVFPEHIEIVQELGQGATSRAYLVVDLSLGIDRPVVAKVERLQTQTNPITGETLFYSEWREHGLDEERVDFTGDVDEQWSRHNLTLTVRDLILEAGIPVVKSYGTRIWESEEGHSMYVELWGYPGPGKMLEEDDGQQYKRLKRLYGSESRREQFKDIAHALYTLAEQGIIIDVSDGRFPFRCKDLKFPKNLYCTDEGELVFIDYGFLFDLSEEPWWHDVSTTIPFTEEVDSLHALNGDKINAIRAAFENHHYSDLNYRNKIDGVIAFLEGQCLTASAIINTCNTFEGPKRN